MRDRLLRYVIALADRGDPFDMDDAAEAIGCAVASVRTLLHNLSDHITVISAKDRPSARRYFQIRIIATGKATAWPVGIRLHGLDFWEQEDGLYRARAEVEANRKRHVAHWLARERAPRARQSRAEPFFIDKETARALSGGYA